MAWVGLELYRDASNEIVGFVTKRNFLFSFFFSSQDDWCHVVPEPFVTSALLFAAFLFSLAFWADNSLRVSQFFLSEAVIAHPFRMSQSGVVAAQDNGRFQERRNRPGVHFLNRSFSRKLS